jgi:C4-dicarboxylate-specific signal transduction histidine kinase
LTSATGAAALRAEAMLVVADLLGGVLHELNNPLGILVAQALVLQERLGETPEGVRAARIARAAERCARLAREFSSLARETPRELRVLELNPIVQETLFLFGHAVTAARVEVQVLLQPGLPSLKADSRDLRLVVAGLLGCALHALRGASGPPVLRVATRVADDPRRVLLEIGHNGPATSGEPRAVEGAGDAPTTYLPARLVEQAGGRLLQGPEPAARLVAELPPASVRGRASS